VSDSTVRSGQGAVRTGLSLASLARVSRLLLRAAPLALLVSCKWFTDFKEQPKIDPWDLMPDSSASRGNPQSSVSLYGTVAPDFIYGRTSLDIDKMSGLQNPTPADSASVARGRKLFQINCAVCHGPLGMGNGPAVKYGVYPPAIGAGSAAANTRSDGYIFGIIRNGRNLMPTYNRIEEPDRWDIINYIRSIEGKNSIPPDTTHGLPGETGETLPGATQMGPTRPAPYYNVLGSQAGAHEGLTSAAPSRATPIDSTSKPAAAAKTPAKPPVGHKP
jgi:mono/diheme cytochrome c family protein